MPPWLSGRALHWYQKNKNAEVPSSTLGGGFEYFYNKNNSFLKTLHYLDTNGSKHRYIRFSRNKSIKGIDRKIK